MQQRGQAAGRVALRRCRVVALVAGDRAAQPGVVVGVQRPGGRRAGVRGRQRPAPGDDPRLPQPGERPRALQAPFGDLGRPRGRLHRDCLQHRAALSLPGRHPGDQRLRIPHRPASGRRRAHRPLHGPRQTPTPLPAAHDLNLTAWLIEAIERGVNLTNRGRVRARHACSFISVTYL